MFWWSGASVTGSEFVMRSGNQMFQYYGVGNIQCWVKGESHRAYEMSEWQLSLVSAPLRWARGGL